MKLLSTVLCALLFCTQANAQVTGAGASFPYPLYSKWIYAYSKETGKQINYQSIGSGGGIAQVKAGTVSFGATDIPLNDKDLSESNLTQFPTVVGAVVPVVNLPNDQEVNLTDAQLVAIFSGDIVKWNDPRLASASSKPLPNIAITSVHRSDGSGTTYIWTSYLSKVSSAWKEKYGAESMIDWESGIGAKGNEGIAGNVRQIKGSIGYVEYAYAKQNKMNIIRINGKAANTKSFESKQWPITAPTYILVPKNSKDRNEVLKFFDWAKKNGGTMAKELDYIPLN